MLYGTGIGSYGAAILQADNMLESILETQLQQQHLLREMNATDPDVLNSIENTIFEIKNYRQNIIQGKALAKAAKEGLRFTPAGDIVDFCELTTGREYCDPDGKELTRWEMIAAGLGLFAGNRRIWSELSSKLLGKQIFEEVEAVADTAQRIGVSTKEGIKEFADFTKRTFGNEVGAVGKDIGQLVDASLNAAKQATPVTLNKVYQGTFETSEKALAYHLMKHGKGRTAKQYIDDATSFFTKNRHLAESTTLQSGTKGLSIKTKFKDPNGGIKRMGGFFTEDGKVVTFWD